jgi:hypothetical protein
MARNRMLSQPELNCDVSRRQLLPSAQNLYPLSPKKRKDLGEIEWKIAD